MLSEHIVAAAARAAGIEAPARYVETTGSTNDDLIAAAAAGAPEWTVLVAGQQTAGRGRLGRVWLSPPGMSVSISVLVRPRIRPQELPIASLAAGAAMATAVREGAGVAAGCKWPNDVVVGDRKLAGILPEARIDGDAVDAVVVGTGLNVLQRPADFPEELRETATSIALEGGDADAGAIQELLARYLLELRRLIREPAATLAVYRGLCMTLGRKVRAVTATGTVEGDAVDLGPHGELVIERPYGVITVSFGEVTHLR